MRLKKHPVAAVGRLEHFTIVPGLPRFKRKRIVSQNQTFGDGIAGMVPDFQRMTAFLEVIMAAHVTEILPGSYHSPGRITRVLQPTDLRLVIIDRRLWP